MAHTVEPTNPLQPDDAVGMGYAHAELRGLKQRVNDLETALTALINSNDTDIATLISDLDSEEATTLAHRNNTSNPHSVTKAQVGLSNADNTADVNKPVSTAQQTALDLKADSTTVTSHTGNTSNPHSVTKAQVGLGNCDNTSDLNKPISTATQTALDSHTNNVSNPHSVTKAQVGLSNCDNTSDLSKPISTATQLALDGKLGGTTTSVFSGTADPLDLYSLPGGYPGNGFYMIQFEGLALWETVLCYFDPTIISGTQVIIAGGGGDNEHIYEVQLTAGGLVRAYIHYDSGSSQTRNIRGAWKLG